MNNEDKTSTILSSNRNKKFPILDGTFNNLKKSSSSSILFNGIKKKSEFDSYNKFFNNNRNLMKKTGFQSPQNSILNYFSLTKKFPIFNKVQTPSSSLKRSGSHLDFLNKKK